MACGIYYILNKENGKIYIGQSIDLDRRLKEHKTQLKSNRHENEHLQFSWNTYGEKCFEFSILKKCDEAELDDLETNYIAHFDSTNREKGYNYETGGNKNKRLSEETKRKLSEAHKGKTIPEEIVRKISEANRGQTRSEEIKKKLSEVKKGENNPFYGKTHSEETKQKMSERMKGKNNPFYGKTHSEETKRKISEANSGENSAFYGKPLPEETKRKISEGNKGKIRSEETMVKMSIHQNTSGYYRVYKHKNPTCKQGFDWAYRYYDKDGVRRTIKSVDLEKLKEKVLAKGLKWYKFEE